MVSELVPPTCRYRTEMDAIMARWRRLGTTLTENAQRIQELMAKLLQFEVWVRVKIGIGVRVRWMVVVSSPIEGEEGCTRILGLGLGLES